MTTTIHTVLAEFREAKTSNREMGDAFERLIAGYLNADPLYADKFSDVWLWQEWPGRANKPDTGIDLVAKERNTGDHWAIQCKFYDPAHTLQKGDLDSFFTASGKPPFTQRMVVSTTDKWGVHAEEAIRNQQIPVVKLRVQDLDDSPVDWSKFSLKRPDKMATKPKKTPRPHQVEAIEKAMAGFQTADRGKLIMACGTGKTFTALQVAERFANDHGKATVLFLVPSLSLLSQTLREWTAETRLPLASFAVCSDTKVGKRKDEDDISVTDLPFPATTDAKRLVQQIRMTGTAYPLTVIFSTYQSIEAVAGAQAHGVPDFDLIICDEAHRTTGAKLAGQDESAFTRVHDETFIKGNKRLYMTATPRLYGEDSKAKAKDYGVELCSMDDPALYGEEFYRLGFGEAVSKRLLTDYKVLVLAVSEVYADRIIQQQLKDTDHTIALEDTAKIIGCWNGLAKVGEAAADFGGDCEPMRRAVAFSSSIEKSKQVMAMFNNVVNLYRQKYPDKEKLLALQADHVDGKHNALERNAKLDWLKADPYDDPHTPDDGRICRILSNARCLSEGVDVPALDAVMFLNPRKSQVDVVQSVGRVMRLAEGKDYGYIILPIVIPAGETPEQALDSGPTYQVVWQILQALRAHDDRFDATVNKLELNDEKPANLQVNGIGFGDGKDDDSCDTVDTPTEEVTQIKLDLGDFDKWREAIYAKIVKKCGSRKYWETWADDIADIARRHIVRINGLLDSAEPPLKEIFDRFLAEIQETLNSSITRDDTVEMLAQHLITRPVFNALFEDAEFTQQNPISKAMQAMLDALEGYGLENETQSLAKFYDSVRQRASGIDNPKGRQAVVVELYDKFFRNAFPKMAKRLGIVYTPVEIVDFILESVDYLSRKEFGKALTDKEVTVLDPFTGTGTFMVRLLQSHLIKDEDLQHKYLDELKANEIVLLAYYIAAINIEEAFHRRSKTVYQPFKGMVLTDTFKMQEGKTLLTYQYFGENDARIHEQRDSDIRIIVGNPPYSAGQTSENDGNKNLKYPILDDSIRQSYAKYSTATNKNSLYDSYIRGIRWASDRIQSKGIIGYVTNGSFIDGNAMDGLRASLTGEFSRIYCFNLRGNARTSAEQRRMESGNVFGEGTRTPIAITLLIKDPTHQGDCQLFYHDIGDYLDRKTKLQMIADYGNIKGMNWKPLHPNKAHDWINFRDLAFSQFVEIGNKEDKQVKTVFETYSGGLKTNRDTWAYNFSKTSLSANMTGMIDFYNQQVKEYQQVKTKPSVEQFIDNDPKKISWSRGLKNDLARGTNRYHQPTSIVKGLYRPYCKQWAYFDKYFNDMVYQMPKFFPDPQLENLVIGVSGVGASKDFSALISNALPDLEFVSKSQCFPRYTYHKVEASPQPSLFKTGQFEGYERKDNITDAILTEFQQVYGNTALTKDDIFYYVYGVLHSPEYKQRFESDLKKMLPRIPYTADFWAFSRAGAALAEIHLNYETIDPYPLEIAEKELVLDPKTFYQIKQMTFPRGQKPRDKPDTIHYNENVTVSGIPPQAYDYIVNGKSALEWIKERYAVTVDKDSGIRNDPNDWSDDPRYILDLLCRIVRVSVETVAIVESLPALNERVAVGVG